MSKTKIRAYSVSNVVTKKFSELEFSGPWENTLGRPDKTFSAIIFGDSSNGKTEAAFQLAKYLTNFGSVDYDSLEQGLSATIQLTVIRNHLESTKHSFRLLDRVGYTDLLDRISKPKSAAFFFIDTSQYLRINLNQYIFIKELALKKGKSLIWLSQANGKKPKGSVADYIRYDVDLKLWVEGYKLFPEGRLNGGGEPYVIWPEGAAKYWKEIE